MNPSGQIRSWDGIARGLHWSMAALFLLQAAAGWLAQAMDRSPARVDVMTLHKSLGVTLLLLVLIRLLWRWTHAAPPPPRDSGSWEINAARAGHAILYLLMVALPVSGLVAASAYVVPWKWWWLLPWPRMVGPDRDLYEAAAEWHEGFLSAFLAIVTVHVAAALWHHFIRRDGVLTGMLRGTRR